MKNLTLSRGVSSGDVLAFPKGVWRKSLDLNQNMRMYRLEGKKYKRQRVGLDTKNVSCTFGC